MIRPRALWSPLARAWPLWLVMAVCIGLVFGGTPLRDALRYDHAAIVGGAWWRIFTGNFVHLGWTHVSLDMAGLVLLWILTGRRLAGWRWMAVTIAGSWGVGLGLWIAEPQVVWYVGISAVAHTYWAAGALLLIKARDWEGWPLLILLAGKLAWEQSSGPLPSSEAIMHEPILTSAHLMGAISGIVLGLILLTPWFVSRLRGWQAARLQ